MNNSTLVRRPGLALAMLLSFWAGWTGPAFAQSAVKLQGAGSIMMLRQGTASLALEGTASHLGKYVCVGELALLPGVTPGSLTGNGVAVFRAANGDLLVGFVTCQLNDNGLGNLAFHWQDFVRFSDGTVVSSTGRFMTSRPPGALSAFQYALIPPSPRIIAILIGP